MDLTTSNRPDENATRHASVADAAVPRRDPARCTDFSVVHVVSRRQHRGAETVALELAEELSRNGIGGRVLALGAAATGNSAREMESLSNSSRIDGVLLVPIVRKLREVLRTSRPNVVLAHGGQAALASVLAARGLDVPIVWQRILEIPPRGLRWPRQSLWNFVARNVDGVVAITPRVADEVQTLGFRGPLRIEPNHRRWARFRELDRASCRTRLVEELDLPPSAPLIGFVGHLVEQKRPELAVSVLQRMSRQDVRLLVVGDGPLRHAVALAAERAGLADRVTMLGHRRDVPELLAALDALVVTSQSETMTGTVIEAQMAGCPVVSFDLDGIDTVVAHGSTGFIVGMNDVAGMAAAVDRLLDGFADGENVADEAQRRGQKFSTEAAARRYAEFLMEVSHTPRHVPRVLFLMPNFGVGGAERAIFMIAQHAARGGFEPVVASLGPPRRDEGETVLIDLRAIGVEVHDLGLRGRADRSPITLARAAWRLRQLCRRLRIDIIDSCLFEADLVARFATIGTRIRHVVHLVNTPYDQAVADNIRGRGAWRFRAVQAIDAITGRLTDRFIPITRAVADAAMRDVHIPRAKLTVVPRGVDLTRFNPQPFTRDPAGPLRILSVGRLVPQKDHRTAIAAVRIARSQGACVRYDVAGEGPLEQELVRTIEEAGLGGVVSLLPPTRDVPGLLGAHDVFCFPSLWEGLGNALIEAMACARPVIASDIPVLREVVGELGVYFRPGDAADLADRLRDVASWSPDRLRSVGAAMRARAESQFAAPLQSERLGAVYRELLGLSVSDAGDRTRSNQ